MSKNNLVERYIYAVTRHLPLAKREDVGKELKSLIEDMLLERGTASDASDQEIKPVLMELGSPMGLAERYSSEKSNCLIGQPHFSAYKLVLKIVLGAVGLGLTIAAIVGAVLGETGSFGSVLGSWLSSLFNGLLQAFAWVTVIFAVLYRKDVKIDFEEDSLDDLPDVPQKSSLIPRSDAIGGIIFTMIFTALFIITPRTNIPIIGLTERLIPVFNPVVLEAVRPFLLISVMAGLIHEIVRLYEGRYNLPVLITTLLSNFLAVLAAANWLTKPEVFNPEFIEKLSTVSGLSLRSILDKGCSCWGYKGELPFFAAVLLALVVFSAVLDITICLVKTFRRQD